MARDDDPLIGRTLLGKLRVLRRIGAGGMGVVYEVEHLLTRHHRALKVLRKELATQADAVARFVREAGAAGTIRSPFLVETQDAGQLEDGSVYVLMELLDGTPLSTIMQGRRLDPARILPLVAQACEGVAAAHTKGIIHRDLKPDNLFIVRDEQGAERIKILDFGISKFSEATRSDFGGSLTADGTVLGTPYYMSPEQAQSGGDVDGRADLYSLGVILYEALSGARPYEAPTLAALVIKIYQGEHVLLHDAAPDVDRELCDVVESAMHRERDKRPSTAMALRDALLEHVPGASKRTRPLGGVDPAEERSVGAAIAPTPLAWSTDPGSAASLSEATREPRATRRGYRAAIVAACGLAVIALLVVWSLGHDSRRERQERRWMRQHHARPYVRPAAPSPEPRGLAPLRAAARGPETAQVDASAPPVRRAIRSRRGDRTTTQTKTRSGIDREFVEDP